MPMTFPLPGSAGEYRRPARSSAAPGLYIAFGLLLCAALSMLPTASAYAESCWVGQAHLDLGDVTSGGGSGSGTLTYTCSNYTNAPTTVTACLYMNPNEPDGVAPRRMVQWYPESYLSYDLYSDPAHSQIIGSESSGHAVYASTLHLRENGQFSQTINLHARVPAGQNAAAGTYVNQMTPVLRYVFGPGTTPPTVAQCMSGARATNYSTVTARFANTCHISAATDLEFGNVSTLDTARDQTSAIQLQCPVGTVWRVGLNEGSHAAGDARRMAGPGGGHVRYELYRDSARSQRWGNTVDTDTSNGTGTGGVQALTVHGRVPAQETPVPGAYSDTVTVTLTF